MAKIKLKSKLNKSANSDWEIVDDIPMAKNGIKTDPQGYWNKENHGKPVRIPSNQITMQGVDQPLYGIDNTGFAQMMYPEQDYTFPGNSVTEFPVMQKGGEIKNPINEFKPKFANSNENIQRDINKQDEYKNSKFYQDKLVLDAINYAEEENRQKYIPSNAVLQSKAAISASQLVNPSNLYLKAIGTGADLATAINYGIDGQYDKAKEDAIQAGVNWIPFLKGKNAMKAGTYNLSKADKLFNLSNKALQKTNDSKTISEAFKHGGKINSSDWEILNETPIYQQGGKVVSEIWQEVTGTPWSKAKKMGLTKGGYEENLAIREELLKNPEKFTSLIKGHSKQPVQQQTNQPSPKQPIPAYKWSEQPVNTPTLATVDTPTTFPTKTTLTKPLPNLPLITNPIDSPYFQAPIESTKVVPQMIKKPVQQPKKQSEDSLNFDKFASDLYKNASSKFGQIEKSIEDYSGKVKEIASTVKKEGLENAKEQLLNYTKKPKSYSVTPKAYTSKKQPTVSSTLPIEEELDSYKEIVEVDKDFTINTFSKKLQNKKIGVRNRMDDSDVKGKPLFYTYAPFKPYKEHIGNSYGDIKINKDANNTPVIAYKGDKLIAGKLGDFKNTDALISPTHKINDVSELVIDNNNKYNEGIKQKMIKVKTSKGDRDLPIGVKDASSNKFESWSGGHLLVENPNTGELTVLHGKSNQLIEMFSKFLKQNNLKNANILETDHKAYSLIKTPKSGVMKGSYNRMLDNYNTAESGSGNFVYEY